MKLRKICLLGVFALLPLVVIGLIGCSTGTVPIQSTGKSTLHIDGVLPDWDLEEMVEQSDAIAIGIIKTNLGSKREAGGINDPPTYYYEFTDFKLEVERDFHPGTLPENIAFLAETGLSAADDNIAVVGFEGVPEYELEDRVLLFMESMSDDEEFGDGTSWPVPNGFDIDNYYLVIVSGPFGKLVRDGEKWEDSRTGDSFTTQELLSAIEEVKKNSSGK